MTASPAADFDARSRARQVARLSVLAAFVSCACNCVFAQLASRIESAIGRAGWLVDWITLGIVLTGIGCGGWALAAGLKRKSADTALIAAIGLVLNLGIIFVIAWYFLVLRPA